MKRCPQLVPERVEGVKDPESGLAGRRAFPPSLDPLRTITVVSGMPRSGTSMMMQMLEAAGLPIATDGGRRADEDNPRGYYELDAVKRLRQEASFLADLVGRVVKVVAPLLPALPDDFDYRVIFMERDLDEVLASQRTMLERLGDHARSEDDEAISRAFRNESQRVKDWLAEHRNVATCFVSHRHVLVSPARASLGVIAFLEETGALSLPGESADASQRKRILSGRMAAVVDPALYRRRYGNLPST